MKLHWDRWRGVMPSPINPHPLRDMVRRFRWCWRCAGHRYVGEWGLPYYWELKVRLWVQAWRIPQIICPRCRANAEQGDAELVNILHDMEA